MNISRMPRLSLLWLALLALTCSATAQAGAPLRVDRLSVEDGLSQTTAWTVLQDSRGFLWIGTEEGLNRHDGYDFDVFQHDPEDPHSLAESEVHALLEDAEGSLWIGTAGGGLDRFVRTKEWFEHHKARPDDPSSLSHNQVLSLALDDKGELWVGTARGLDHLLPDGRFEHYLQDMAGDPPQVFCLERRSGGGFWVGTDRGLFELDATGQTTLVEVLPGSHAKINALAHDPQGHLWVATTEPTLCRMEAEGCVRPPGIEGWPDDQVLTLYFDPQGGLWAGTLISGLYRLPPNSERFVVDRHDPADPHSLSDDSIISLHRDHSGTLWLGTYVGLNKFDVTQAAFTTYRHRPGHALSLSSNSAWAIHEDLSGELWVGTFNHGLNRIDTDRRSNRVYSPDPNDPTALPGGAINGLEVDHQNGLWIATWSGLAYLDPERRRFTSWTAAPEDPGGLASDLVHAVLQDRRRDLWVGTYNGLQRLVLPRGPFEWLPGAPKVPIQVLYEDRSGALWAGSDRGGLFRRVEDDFEAFAVPEIGPLKVATLLEDQGGDLWIGTYGNGLVNLDSEHNFIEHITSAEGLPNNTVLGVLEDHRGHLWLSTNRGLVRYDPESRHFDLFDVDDGLQGNVFSSGAYHRGQDGSMYFGGVQGLSTFLPEEVVRNEVPPRVVITGFELFNRKMGPKAKNPRSPLESSILETVEITLTHRDYLFALEFAALHYKSPRRNRYAYRLEGLEPEWIETDASRRFAQYSNLSPGKYTFQVRGASADGIWDTVGDSLSIQILPPPWRSWWAYTLYALVALILLYFALRSQHYMRRHMEHLVAQRAAEVEQLNTQLKIRNAELEGFTYTVSHDLKSPLITIRGFLGLLRQDVAEGNAQRIEDDCDRIERAAGAMQELLDDLLELSRIGRFTNPPREVPLDALVPEVLELLAGPLRRSEATVKVAPNLPTVWGDPVRIREVLQNLLENAVKYLGDPDEPHITLSAEEIEHGQVRVAVSDNGIGIDTDHRDRIFGLFQQLDKKSEGTGVGLALVRRIVEFHGGKVWVESEGLGHGSTFYFTLPTPAAAQEEPSS